MRGTQGERLSPLVALNLVCLDAPLVAIAWQQLFGHERSLHVSAAARVALFATAWLIYLTDRLADSWPLASTAPASARQRFAREHRTLFVLAIAGAIMADAVAIPHLDRATLHRGAIVGSVLVIYLLLNRFVSSVWRLVPVKEIVIGVLFAAGVFASLSGGSGAPLRAATAFAGLCAINCVSIAFWECELDAAQDRSSIATTFPSLKWLPVIACALIAIAAASLSQRLAFICIAMSAALLGIVNLLRIQRDTRTALADLVLLTPLIALPFAS